MDDVKIRVIDSDKLVNAIKEGSYDINLSAVMALGAVVLDSQSSAQPTTCKYWDNESGFCALHRPSAQPEQRWIPVSERPPEKSGEYLVCDEYKNILKKWYWTAIPGWTAHEGRIIAWMPLPEPWEEGAEDHYER